MWWILFTAADLYLGLIVLQAIAPSLPAEKRARLATARKVIYAGFAILGIAAALKLWR